MKAPPELVAFLKETDRFFITTHINPEPDALGSSLALSAALEALGKTTVLYNRDGVPGLYRFLPGHEKFTHTLPSSTAIDMPLLLLDCNLPARAGIEGLTFPQSVVIDHHETQKDFGTFKWVRPDAAATGLMIFYLLKELGTPLTKDSATNLYAALAIDTGTFRYSNTRAEVLSVAAELVDAGADPSDIAVRLYETWTRKRFNLLCLTLNTLELRDDVAIVTVTREMFEQTDTVAEDTETFVGFPRMMEDIAVSALFRQDGHDLWKVSLRSKGAVNVAEIASQFKGGGHRNAAGYQITGDIETVKKELMQALSRPGAR